MANHPVPSPEDIAGPAAPSPLSSTPASPSPPPAAAIAAVAGPSDYASRPQPGARSPVAAEQTHFTAYSDYPGSMPSRSPAPGAATASSVPFYGAGGAGGLNLAAAAAALDTPQSGAADNNQPKTFRQRMAGSDECWQWKLGLRLLLCVLDIIAIGAIAAVISTKLNDGELYWDYFDNEDFLPYSLITLGVSFVWCLVYVLVLLLRRPPRPAHPGIAVGIDLVLWLAFIITLLFNALSVASVVSFGAGGYIDDPSYPRGYTGVYTMAPNGTWVFEFTTVNGHPVGSSDSDGDGSGSYNVVAARVAVTPSPTLTVVVSETASPVTATRTLVTTSTYSDPYNEPYSDSYDDGFSYSFSYQRATTTTTSSYAYATTATRRCSEFASCAEQDAFVNALWHERSRLLALDTLGAVVQGIALLTHFALFVWACVDTHRRNRMRRTAAVTLSVLQDMQLRGYTMVPTTAVGTPGGAFPAAAAMPSGGLPTAAGARVSEKAPARFA